MEKDTTASSQQMQDASGFKMGIAAIWLISLLVTGYVSFTVGQNGSPSTKGTEKSVLSEVNKIESLPTNSPSTTQTTADATTCSKSGYAQQWEYLKSYVIKENDTLQGIAKSELHDETRINEIMQINGVGQLIVGSTLYLPPDTVSKSAGKLKQVSGKLIEKSASMWHVSFNNDKDGIGILIPTYWFEGIADKDTYNAGDCLTILLDDGFKVFSVSRQ